jgi:hypothetical protein
MHSLPNIVKMMTSGRAICAEPVCSTRGMVEGYERGFFIGNPKRKILHGTSKSTLKDNGKMYFDSVLCTCAFLDCDRCHS